MSGYTLTSPIDVKSSSASASQINIYPGNASTFSVQLRSPSSLTGNVQFILPSLNGTNGQFLQYGTGVGGACAWATGTSNPTTTLPLSLRFNSSSGAPASTNSNTFITLGQFYYGGTSVDNVIASGVAVVRSSNASALGQLQVFDYTHSAIIATSSIFGPTSGLPTIVNIGTISNLPTSSSIFEIRLRKTNGGGGSVGIYSFQLIG